MSVPQFIKKYGSPAILTARASIAHRSELSGTFLKTVLLVYREHVAQHLCTAFTTERIEGFGGRIERIKGTDVAIASGFGIGGPAVAALIEDLHAVGVDTIVSTGTCGQLAPSSSQVLICERALRDEGVSHHYMPAERFAIPDTNLMVALERHLVQSAVEPARASSWTTDALYRETVAERDTYLREGITCVEMEAASLFTVARALGIRSTSVFVVSDVSDGEDHHIAFGDENVIHTLEHVSESTLKFLLSEHQGA